MRSKIPCEWLRNIYYSFVYPRLLYGIEIYANTCVTYLDKLIKLNNKILRILQKCPIHVSTHVLELYTKFNVLPLLDKLHNHQIILLVFKCLNYAHLLPPLYANYFVLNAEVHDYNTRAVLIYMFLVLEVLTDKGVLDMKEVCYGIDYLLD